MLKICCNHAIVPLLVLKPLQTSDRTWTWSAQDFSEGELVQETFALKFKTMEQAQKFKSVFEEARAKAGAAGKNAAADATVEEAKANGQPSTSSTSSAKSLSELFKPKEGSWECQGCFLRNAEDVVKCPSCETVKPGSSSASGNFLLSFRLIN